MYSGQYAIANPDRPAFIMAGSGIAVSYAEFEARSNKLAHFLRDQGLGFQDHYAIFMENNERYMIKQGDYFRIKKGTPHAVKVTSIKPLKMLSVQAPEFFGKDRIFLPEKE